MALFFSIFAAPYTLKTPKRLYISFLENVTASERGIHLAFADIGSQIETINSLEQEFQVKAIKRSRVLRLA